MAKPRPPAAQPHTTVLLAETVEHVLHKPNGLYVDATFGRGGHSRLLLSRLGPEGRLIALDQDAAAVAAAADLDDPRFSIHHRSFSELPAVLSELGLGPVDGILADLGVSSPQLDEAQRGFSFLRDGPLDMRMDQTRGLPASEWLKAQDETTLTEVIRDYGEERHARALAKEIVARIARAQQGEAEPLERTTQLASLVESVLRRRSGSSSGLHPATRTFQAIRIAVNRELDELDRLIDLAPTVLADQGRLAIISFHSLEDRRVKQGFRAQAQPALIRPRGMGRQQFGLLADLVAAQAGPAGDEEASARLTPLVRVMPSAQEVQANPRARSAVLRVAERRSPHRGAA